MRLCWTSTATLAQGSLQCLTATAARRWPSFVPRTWWVMPASVQLAVAAQQLWRRQLFALYCATVVNGSAHVKLSYLLTAGYAAT